MSTEPITGLTYQDAGSLQTDALQNAELNYYGAWLNCAVLSVGDTAPPGSPADGDRYIVGATATGAWATHDDKLAVYRDGWQFYEAIEGVSVHNLADASDWIFEGSGGWALKVVGGASAWGAITGTLSAQTDLQAALDAKLALAGGSLTGALNEAKGTDLASAGTTNIASATGNFVHITGTTTITALGTAQAGTRRILVFDGALLLTHNATSLILPTGANITTVAGDTATMVSEGSGNWRCTSYQRKDGTPLAGGGGSLTNWTEGVNTSTPNATIPAVTFVATNAATNVDAVVLPKGTGAFLLQVPDDTTAGGNKRGAGAIDLQRTRGNQAQVASGTASFISGGQDNTTAGASAAIAGGNGNSVSSSRGFNGGGQANTVSGVTAGNIAGDNNTASGVSGVTLGGSANTASGLKSIAHGYQGNTRSIECAMAHGVGATNQVLSAPLYIQTTSATPAVLASNSSAAAATNQYALPSSRAGMVRVRVIARQSAGSGTVGDCAGWDTNVLIKNIGGTTTIVGTPSVTQAYGDAGAATWAIAITANNTLDCLTITVTGEASKTIQWTAEVIGPEA